LYWQNKAIITSPQVRVMPEPEKNLRKLIDETLEISDHPLTIDEAQHIINTTSKALSKIIEFLTEDQKEYYKKAIQNLTTRKLIDEILEIYDHPLTIDEAHHIINTTSQALSKMIEILTTDQKEYYKKAITNLIEKAEQQIQDHSIFSKLFPNSITTFKNNCTPEYYRKVITNFLDDQLKQYDHPLNSDEARYIIKVFPKEYAPLIKDLELNNEEDTQEVKYYSKAILDLIIKARQQIQDNAENTLKNQLEIYYHPLTLDEACVIIDVFPREYIPLLKDLPEQKAEYYSKAITDLIDKAKQQLNDHYYFINVSPKQWIPIIKNLHRPEYCRKVITNVLDYLIEHYDHTLNLDEAHFIIKVFPIEYIPILEDLDTQEAEYYNKAITNLIDKAEQQIEDHIIFSKQFPKYIPIFKKTRTSKYYSKVITNFLDDQLKQYDHPLNLDEARYIIKVFPKEYIPLLKDLDIQNEEGTQEAENYNKAITNLIEKAQQKILKSRKIYTLTPDFRITEREFPKEP